MTAHDDLAEDEAIITGATAGGGTMSECRFIFTYQPSSAEAAIACESHAGGLIFTKPALCTHAAAALRAKVADLERRLESHREGTNALLVDKSDLEAHVRVLEGQYVCPHCRGRWSQTEKPAMCGSCAMRLVAEDRLVSAEATVGRLRGIFDAVCQHFFDDNLELDAWDFYEMGEKAGLLEQVAYDPTKHGEMECEPGEMIYVKVKDAALAPQEPPPSATMKEMP